jgi:septal ring factor EnvC (AmiA/AmiB activator)
MWPKALAQLIELLPHLSRLLPMADRFLASKTADQEANTRAMQQMAEGLRGDLGQVTASHAGLYRQLIDQSEKLSELSTDLAVNRKSLQTVEDRIAALESTVAANRVLLLITLLVSAMTFVILIVRKH